MIRVCLVGAGRMGRAFFDAASVTADVRVVSAIDPGALALPSGVAVFDSHTPQALAGVDVVVDFSSPEGFERSVALACNAGVPMVGGVTGVPSDQMTVLRQRVIDSGCAAVFAPNFSVGVAAFMQAAAMLARTLSGYDLEIVEMHHRQKADAPSGTASRLAHVVVENGGKSGLVHGRVGATARENEVGVHAVRAGDFFGDHLLILAGNGEHVELRHSAHSRACFAGGAISAVRFVCTAAPGVYSMDNVVAAGVLPSLGD